MATVLLILLVVGYAWSVWSLWRQMHFGDTPAAPTSHLDAVASPSRSLNSRARDDAYRTGSTLPHEQIAPASSVSAEGNPTPRREILDVRKEIEARVLALKSV